MKKEGLTWIGKRTNQFRYSAGGHDQWVQPLSVYIAGEAIQRGHVVSIARAQDFQGATRIVSPSIASDNNLVVLTRTDRHDTACGIAMETVQPGDTLHVTGFGRFRYNVDRPNEYSPTFANSDRGRSLFVGTGPGTLTFDRDGSVLGSRNLIQIGIISNAHLDAASDPHFDIEVQLDGDGRGPLETTQFEVAMGEPYFHNRVFGGIPVRAFAIGQGNSSVFQYQFHVRRPTQPLPSSTTENLNAWIAFHSPHRAYFLIFGPSSIPHTTTPADFDRVQHILHSTQAGTESVQYIPLYTTADPPASWGNLHVTQTDLLDEDGTHNRFLNTLFTQLSSLDLSALFGPGQDTTLDVQSDTAQIIVDNDGVQQEISTALVGSTAGGPIYVDWDSSLDPLFGSSVYEQQGSFDIAGRAVLADRRFPERGNVLGILLQGEERAYNPGDTALFLRKGTYVATADLFTPGTTYYLGVDGRLTPFDASFQYPDIITRIGIAKTSRRLIVDVGEPTVSRVAGMPIGGIKPIPAGLNVAEHGFLLMDGTTYHPTEQYPQLVEELLSIFPAEEVFSAPDPDEDDLLPEDEFPPDFIVPRLENPTNNNLYQIKATTYGYEPFMNTSTVRRANGVISNNSIPAIDLTEMAFAGPRGAFEALSLDRLFSRLFIETADGWREIAASWNIQQQDNRFLLQLLSPSLSDWNGRAYRVVVMKPDVFARYSDFDLDIAATTINTIDAENRAPINSAAVVEYIDQEIDTRRLHVHNNTTLGDGVAGDNDQVVINADVTINSNTSEGATTTVTINSKTGLIETSAPMSPLANQNNTATSTSLVTRNYVDDHRSETISETYAVHGIRQGHSRGFDADTVDSYHASTTGANDEIPVVSANVLKIARFIELQNQPNTGIVTTRLDSTSSSELRLTGGHSSRFMIGLHPTTFGHHRWIANNAGTIEILTSNNVGTNYGEIKAAQFKTSSSRAQKENVQVFADSALGILNATVVVKYTYIDQDEPQVGFIAEDTHELLSGADRQSMNIPSTIGVLIRAVQELSQQNQELLERVIALENRI